jgi:hypothetical protein
MYERRSMEAASPAPHDCGRSFRFLVLPVARPLAFCLTLCLGGFQLGPVRAADLVVTLVSATSPAAPFSDATLIISTAPGANCTIVILYKSGPSRPKDLAPQLANGAGKLDVACRLQDHAGSVAHRGDVCEGRRPR